MIPDLFPLIFPETHFESNPEYSKKIPDNTEEFIDPILELGAHVAPTGLSFYDGDHFPEKYKNTLFFHRF